MSILKFSFLGLKIVWGLNGLFVPNWAFFDQNGDSKKSSDCGSPWWDKDGYDTVTFNFDDL